MITSKVCKYKSPEKLLSLQILIESCDNVAWKSIKIGFIWTILSNGKSLRNFKAILWVVTNKGPVILSFRVFVLLFGIYVSWCSSFVCVQYHAWWGKFSPIVIVWNSSILGHLNHESLSMTFKIKVVILFQSSKKTQCKHQ